MTPPPPASPDWCLFLDVDGTLIEFTDTPSQTIADPDIKSLLSNVALRFGGAVALVSGREIRTLDALFAPLRLAASGLHGIERRTAAGEMLGPGPCDPRLAGVRVELAALARAHAGVLIEDKGRTIAVHFRLAPHCAPVVRSAVMAVAASLGADYHIQEGAMLLELKPRGTSKATAVEAFMREAPFLGRRPVFIGDDLTDLDGFAAVEARGGFSIGVGPRVRGLHHLDDVAAVRKWLSA
jgi:trehalose 6-phosphate phosphatase